MSRTTIAIVGKLRATLLLRLLFSFSFLNISSVERYSHFHVASSASLDIPALHKREDAVNSINSVNTMLLGVVNRFAYVSTVVTRDMKQVATGHLVRTGLRSAATLINALYGWVSISEG